MDQTRIAPPGAADARRQAGQWYLLGIVTFSYVVAFVDRSALPLMVQPIKADLQITDIQISLLLGLGLTLIGSVLTVPAGWLVDRMSRRLLLAASIVTWSAMTIFSGLARGFPMLLAGRAGVGISEAGITPAGFSLIRSVFPPARRGRAFALFSLGPPIAGGLALLLGGSILSLAAGGAFAAVPLLAGLHGWQVVLVLYGLFGIVPLLLMLTVAEPARPPGAANDARYAVALRHIGRHWRLYAPIFGFATLNAMLAFSISAWLPAMIGRLWHLTPPQIGLRFGLLLLLVSPAGGWLTGVAIDRVVRRGVAGGPALVGFVTSTLAGLLIVAIPNCTTLATAFPLIAVLFAVYGSFYPVGAALLARLTPEPVMGKVSALYILSQTLCGQALAPTLIAAAAQSLFDGPRAIGDGLALCGGVFAACGLVCLTLIYRGLLRRGSVLADDMA